MSFCCIISKKAKDEFRKMQFTDEQILDITDMSHDARGIAHTDDGYTVFADGGVTGDRVRAKIYRTRKASGYAEITEYLCKSPLRQTPDCPYFSECGGCCLSHMTDEGQKHFKKRRITEALRRIGGISADIDFIEAENPYRYRNKMIFPFSPKGEWGFYKRGTHEVIPLKDCLLGDKLNADILNTVGSFFSDEKIPFYNEATHTGSLRRVFTRTSSITGEIMVVISVNADNIPHREKLVFRLRRISERITSIMLNINKERTNLTLGQKNIPLYGKKTITDSLCGLMFEVSPNSFFQINHEQTELLYAKALEYAACSEKDTVFDIYCGIGTMTLAAARKSKRAVGIEIVPQAIENAKENAVRNGITNADFICAAAEDAVAKLIGEGAKPDVVILDPPRKGSDEKTLAAILTARPEKIVYVSCNPATLARDLKFLTAGGYTTAAVTGFDLFPQTNHVETVVKLIRKKQDVYPDYS